MSDARPFLELVTDYDNSVDPLTVAEVRDDHLRAANGSDEDAYVSRLMKVSLRLAERKTGRALLPQTWTQVMDAFPACGQIVLEKPPLISVDAITYVDEDGVTQTWSASPLPYVVLAPEGATAGRARIRPAYNETWPATRCQPGAVRVTFTCGYAVAGSPAVASVPEDITQGRLLVIGELYKQRTESVHAMNQNPAMIRARDLWMGYRVY